MTAKILTALHEVMSKVGYVQKGKRNAFHNYNYAGESDLLAVLRPAMVEAGLLLIPSVTEAKGPDEFGNTTVRIEYTLAHKDGDVWPEKVCAMGCGNDKNSKGGIGDKGLFKAVTGANKYALFKLFQIETGDDPEGAEHEVAPPSAKPAPKAAAPAKADPAPARAAEPPQTKADTYWSAFWQRPSYELKGANITDPLTFGKAFEEACKRAPTMDALLKLEDDNLTDLAALNNQSPHASKQAKTAFGAAQMHFTNTKAA